VAFLEKDPPPAVSVMQMLAEFDPFKTKELTHMAMAKAVCAVSQDRTLRQLYFELGIEKEPKRKGGDNALQAWLKAHHPKLVGTRLAGLPEKIAAEWEAWRLAHAPTEADRLDAAKSDAEHFWPQWTALLEGDGAPPWGLLETQDMLRLMVRLDAVVSGMKRVLKDRGAR
jgi:hypothetical protein